MRRILDTETEATLGKLAERLNRRGIAQRDIQLIAPEARKFTALFWVNAYTGTLHAEYFDADRDIVKEECTIEEFFQGPLTASSREKALEIALEEWKNHWWNEDAEHEKNAWHEYGWTEYDGETILGSYWVEIDD